MPNEPENPHRFRAIVSAIVAGFFQFVESIASIPPEIQDGLLRQLVDVVPLEWRSNITLFAGILKWVTSAYAVFQASKSGPHPPKSDT